MNNTMMSGELLGKTEKADYSLPVYFLLVNYVNLFQITYRKDIMVLLTAGCCGTLSFCHIPCGLHSEHPSVLYSSLGFDSVLEQCLFFSSALKGLFILLNVFIKSAHYVVLNGVNDPE